MSADIELIRDRVRNVPMFYLTHQANSDRKALLTEVDRLTAELALKQPVIDAANNWVRDDWDDPRLWAGADEFALIDAVRAYRAASGDPS